MKRAKTKPKPSQTSKPSTPSKAPTRRAWRAEDARVPFIALVVLSALLFAVRIVAAREVGFGDSEALYASYALFPEASYLDHPGLIGVFAGLVGGGTAPSPRDAHQITALLATIVAWVGVYASRAAGASPRGSYLAGIALALIPEMAVGLFGMTPDLLLALAWLGALGMAARGLGQEPKSLAASSSLLAAGFFAGVGSSAKVSGLLLLGALFVTYVRPMARAHARTVWPWLGLLIGLVTLSPVLLHEAVLGWPMLRHRLIDTQGSAGISLRNIGATFGGQLVYVSPVVAVAAFFVARDLWRSRREDAVSELLFWAFVVPLAVLFPLCLWSSVAEPHWLAPPLLAVAIHYGRKPEVVGKKLMIASAATAGVLVAFVHAWVLVPALPGLVPAPSYDARADIANELYGWPRAIEAVREQAVQESPPGTRRGDVVVAGPHWVVCAQLQAGLGHDVPVGCMTPVKDDFDRWAPRKDWQGAESIVFVTDERFPDMPELAQHTLARMSSVTTTRGGRAIRRFRILVFKRRVVT